ncbi:unnamed protein product [Caenorhabditis sp. 36 PRJEB53466]|nr:unnamed protein product [Caenorhabditis sp. 36 PRJEB53466]
MIWFLFTAITFFPGFVASVDLKALFSTSEEPVDVFCRFLFFTYVAAFLVAVISAHVYATIVRPEKRQYTYALNPTPSSENDS